MLFSKTACEREARKACEADQYSLKFYFLSSRVSVPPPYWSAYHLQSLYEQKLCHYLQKSHSSIRRFVLYRCGLFVKVYFRIPTDASMNVSGRIIFKTVVSPCSQILIFLNSLKACLPFSILNTGPHQVYYPPFVKDSQERKYIETVLFSFITYLSPKESKQHILAYRSTNCSLYLI